VGIGCLGNWTDALVLLASYGVLNMKIKIHFSWSITSYLVS